MIQVCKISFIKGVPTPDRAERNMNFIAVNVCTEQDFAQTLIFIKNALSSSKLLSALPGSG